MKKDQGNMMSIFPAIFTIIAVAIMLVFYVGWMANVTKKDEVRQIGREYILAMEHGFPPISGIGFGIDVFIYHLLDCENIRDTILFPITKPLDNEKEENED